MRFSPSLAARLVVALFVIACECVAAQSPRTFTLAIEYPATSLPGEGDAAFATRVASLTADLIAKLKSSEIDAALTSGDGGAKAAADTEALQWERAKRRVEENYARMRDNKMTIVTAVSSALRSKLTDAATAAIDAWAVKTEPGRAVLERFRGGSPLILSHRHLRRDTHGPGLV